MDDITSRPLQLDSLLDGIDDGTVVLPEFQRDFDWVRSDVVALIATVLSSWPAGSLLVMKGVPDFFAVREFEDAPRRATRVEHVILDGQQRLTSLFHALRGAGPDVYAINVTGLDSPSVGVDAIEEALVVHSRVEWERDFPLQVQAGDALVPLAALRSPSDFFEWRDEALATLPQNLREPRNRLFTRAYKNLLGRANSYAFPAVVLETSLPPEAVARIFERVNRTGLSLGTFDLLVARTYEQDWNLRDKWDSARRESEHLDRYLGDEGTPLLQTIALAYGGDVRQPALLRLNKPLVHERWDAVVGAYDRALGFVHDRCGASNPNWLPYKTLVLPLAALALQHDLNSAAPALDSWFWGKALSQAYDVGSSTKVASDYDALSAHLRDGTPLPTSTVNMNRLLDATRKQNSAAWRAFMSLLLRNGANDPTGATMTDAVVSSLFPRTSGDGAPHLRVLGQVLTARSTARAQRREGQWPAFATDGAERARHTQFLPDPDRAAPGPEWLLHARAIALQRYLMEEFGGAIETVWEDRDEDAKPIT